MIVDWLKIGGSFASGDIPGVLLKSAMAMVMDMDRLFHCEERSIGKTTVSIFLRIIQNLDQFYLAFNRTSEAEGGLKSVEFFRLTVIEEFN